MHEFEKILQFLALMHRFQNTERRLLVPGTNRKEGDAEHSYQLAMVAWYLIESEKLSLNLSKVLCYALTHDLAEAYAGDTWSFDEKGREDKHLREERAEQQILSEFPEAAVIVQTIQDYNGQKDGEACFVSALDKLLPIFNNYLDEGRSWKEQGVRLEQMLQYKTERIAASPTAKKYFDIVAGLLRERESEFFNPEV